MRHSTAEARPRANDEDAPVPAERDPESIDGALSDQLTSGEGARADPAKAELARIRGRAGRRGAGRCRRDAAVDGRGAADRRAAAGPLGAHRRRNPPDRASASACRCSSPALNQTIIATALPTIGRDFHDFDNLPWLITAYLLSSTVAAPLCGKLSDIYGRRR